MKDKKAIQIYINKFRKELAVKLKPEIGMEVIVHPIKETGAIFELILGVEKSNSDHYERINNKIGQALKKINQHMLQGDTSHMHFKGTSILAENDRIIIIKGGDNPKEWEGDAAANDAIRLIDSVSGNSK